MEPVLDELTLVPCLTAEPGLRIKQLGKTLLELDRLGALRVLRSVMDASSRDISSGKGLKFWCFDRDTDRDAGRIVAGRLDRQPYINGPDGLWQAMEEEKAIDPKVGEAAALGLAFSHLNHGVAVGLSCSAERDAVDQTCDFYCVSGARDWTESHLIRVLFSVDDVRSQEVEITRRVNQTLATGQDILDRATEVLPHLRFGPRALDQLEVMRGTEPYYAQVRRHLREFEVTAQFCSPGQLFDPGKISHSEESVETLQHGKYGPMRDFAVPNGFAQQRWSRHSKIGGDYRIYFRAESVGDETIVLVGYVGPHLPTVNFPN